MALLTDSWLADASLVLLVLLPLLYNYFSGVYGYFRAKGIPYLRPIPLLGHWFMYNKAQAEVAQILYNSFPHHKYFGFFQFIEPTLLVRDPELVHRIMVKDFNHFHDRGFATIDGDFLQTMSLFSLKGATWRALRNKLSPTFSSGKLKFMFDQFTTGGDHLLEDIAKGCKEPIDAKTLAVDFASEVIASTAFGLNFSKENPQSVEFVSQVKDAFKRSGFFFTLIFITVTFAPKLLKWLGVTVARPGTKEYFINLTKATKKYRRDNNIKRNDYFDLLLELQSAEESGKVIAPATQDDEDDKISNQMEYMPDKDDNDNKDKPPEKLLTDELLTAQAFVFLLAGSDTVSSTLSFALYHIAKDQEVRRKLVQEVDQVLIKRGGFSYQAVKEMTYMDQVIQEALRLYPPLPVTLRECTTPYQIPGTNIVLEKGAKVSIPVMGLHKDPKYYPDPDTFKPDRFSGNNHKPNSTYMPFGDGPRICIAIRFAVVEMKVFLSKILSRFEIGVNSKTQEPLIFDKGNFGPKAVDGIWIDFKQRK